MFMKWPSFEADLLCEVNVLSKNCIRIVLKIIGLLFVLQLLRMGIKSVCFIFAERTDFTDRVASLIAMVLLTALILLTARLKKIKHTVFPKHFGSGYIVFTMIAASLLISTPVLAKDSSAVSIVLMVYSAIVVPVFEELIFREFVWNKLNTVFKKEWNTYIVATLLFAVWHLGYVDAIAFRVETGLINAMVWKVITGFCFGVVLGALRFKTKNSYSTMLLHGILNIFGR
ncbi:hypothetical protein OBV_21710 [Oscillibacter valericigenes Sjm18-20]|nr:hypothetical protein OBV_21710 [Oscillibacter valericigenes Sjm18-20]